jgi:RNA polymerase sigma-70 factor (ECF subfamily)
MSVSRFHSVDSLVSVGWDVEQALRSDDEEFERFFADVVDRVKALALRITGNPWDAEDVAVEALARAYARWGRLARVTWRDGWVLKVGGNLAIDLVRRRRTVASRPEDEPGAAAARAGGESADGTGALIDRLTLASALRVLSRREREVAVLVGLCGCSHERAADVLGISIGSSKTYLHRAMGHLRTELGVGSGGGDVADVFE